MPFLEAKLSVEDYMGNLIAYCGMDCTVCPAFIATKNNDQSLREKTAVEWSGEFKGKHFECKPEYINCTGCKGSGVQFENCSQCELRKCADGKKIETCKECGNVKTCKTVKEFIEVFPDAAARLCY
jgi:hypothetical protein